MAKSPISMLILRYRFNLYSNQNQIIQLFTSNGDLRSNMHLCTYSYLVSWQQIPKTYICKKKSSNHENK